MNPLLQIPIKGFVESDATRVKRTAPLNEFVNSLDTGTKTVLVDNLTAEGDGLFGIVTPEDMVRFYKTNLTKETATAGDLATKEVVAIRDDATIGDAIEIMNGNNWLKKVVDMLPVVDRNKRAVGILRRDSLLSQLRLMPR
ncbi:MAG TPA: CBS domain-containing protein [Humisphaera sp.]|nr:CBS domain-containing protein [Humisphaera sp.]